MRCLVLLALVTFVGCGSQAAQQRDLTDTGKSQARDSQSGAKTAAPKPLSTDAEVRTGERERDKEKEQRGNTPPGTDRSGGGPASGAIVDPAGVVTK